MKSYYTELHKGGTKEHRDFRSLLPPQRPARFTRSDIEGRKLQVNMFQVAGSDQKELYGKYWSKRTLEPLAGEYFTVPETKLATCAGQRSSIHVAEPRDNMQLATCNSFIQSPNSFNHLIL